MKKFLSFFLSLCMAFSIFTIPKVVFALGDTDNILKGDVNFDGVVNIWDIMIIRDHIFGKNILKDNAYIAADINDDGNVDIFDIMCSRDFIFGKAFSPHAQPNDNKIKSGVYNSAQETENMADEDLIELARQKDKPIISGFYKPENFGVELSPIEYWHELTTNSASNLSEAENEAKRYTLVQNPESYSIDFIGENKYYYAFRVEYSYINTYYDEPETFVYTNYITIYKESAKHCEFSSQSGYYIKFCALDMSSVMEMLDLEIYLHCNQYYAANIVYREIEEVGNEYIYTFYKVGTVGGLLLNFNAVLDKTEIRVNKNTGEYNSVRTININDNTQRVRETEIPNVPIDFVPQPKNPAVLSTEMKNQVKQTRVDYIINNWDYAEATINDVFIMGYYGTYNDGIAVMLTDRFTMYTQALWTETVAGIPIHYNDGNRALLWKDGVFYTFTAAYEQGLLSFEDVASIAYYRNSTAWNNPDNELIYKPE